LPIDAAVFRCRYALSDAAAMLMLLRASRVIIFFRCR